MIGDGLTVDFEPSVSVQPAIDELRTNTQLRMYAVAPQQPLVRECADQA